MSIDFVTYTPAQWTAFYCDQADVLVRRAERERHEGKRTSLYAAAADLYEQGVRAGTWPTQAILPAEPVAHGVPTYREVVALLDTAIHGWTDPELDYS